MFTLPARSGLFTRLIWNNKPVPTLLAPASLHPKRAFEDVFKFWAYTQQTPRAGSWRTSAGEGGRQWDAQVPRVAASPHAALQGERGGPSLHPVFVIPCQSFPINIILERDTEALGEEGLLF